MNELIQLGKRISEIRIKKGLTQEKLADMVNYSANHIAKLELLVEIAKAMNIPIKELFDFDDLNTPEYMKQDLLNSIDNADKELIKLLYKFKKTLLV